MFGEKIVISDPLLYQGTLRENRICCRCTSGQVELEDEISIIYFIVIAMQTIGKFLLHISHPSVKIFKI